MVADPAARPEVLPTDRLLDNGMARPELRHDLRRIDDVRNAVTVASVWLWVAVIIGGSVWIDRWWAYLAAFVLMGPMYARFAILMHEAAHKLLFTNKRANDWVGTWLIAYPTWTPISIYRRGPLRPPQGGVRAPRTRHRLLRRLPVRPAGPGRRRLVRDAVGISGWKNFTPLFKALGSRRHRRVAGSILGVQVVLWAVMWAATGRWWIYPLLWWLPWMTQWRVINRLRAIAEHGGLEAGPDRRVTTHNVRQSLARPVLVRPLQHRLAPGPPRRHGHPVPQPPGLPRRAGAGRLHHRGDHLPQLPVAVGGAVLGLSDGRPAAPQIRPVDAAGPVPADQAGRRGVLVGEVGSGHRH